MNKLPKPQTFEEIMDTISHIAEVEINSCQSSEELKKKKNKWVHGREAIANWIPRKIREGYDRAIWTPPYLTLAKEFIDYDLLKKSRYSYDFYRNFYKFYCHCHKPRPQNIIPAYDFHNFYKRMEWVAKEIF